ncbi:MAG: hypothetical protein QOJ65_1848 [Fimbriimonadaceae bacterium]|nr:hypothetical protein [Fimbriimonadaceae bacterium]
MLDGGGRPLTMKASALTSDYRAMQIKTAGAGGGGGLMDMIMSPMMMMMGAMGGMGSNDKDQPPFGLFTAMDLSWTTGETQSFFNQNYLVTYKLDLDMAALAKMGPKPKDMTNMDLRLQLVRTDAIQSFTPRPDITREAFVEMLKMPTPPPPPAKPATPAKPGK